MAYTDVLQGVIGWTGCIIAAFYIITHEEHSASPPSIGFPGYIYPDNIGDGGTCDMYQGVPCNNTADACCYNTELWCPKGNGSKSMVCHMPCSHYRSSCNLTCASTNEYHSDFQTVIGTTEQPIHMETNKSSQMK